MSPCKGLLSPRSRTIRALYPDPQSTGRHVILVWTCEISKPTPSHTLPPTRLHLLIFLKTFLNSSPNGEPSIWTLHSGGHSHSNYHKDQCLVIITTLISLLEIISEGAKYWVMEIEQLGFWNQFNVSNHSLVFSPRVFPCFLHSSSIEFLVAVFIQNFCSSSI